MTDAAIDHVFELLDGWRHLPKYQLERRADIYFALFLPDVLQKHYGTSIMRPIIPEFPLKKRNSNSSNNADYFALSKSGRSAFLVELKTDMGSLNHDQIDYYSNASSKKLHEIVAGLKPIVINTSGDREEKMQNRRKYLRLLVTLERLNLIELPPGLKDKILSDNHNGTKGLVESIKVKGGEFLPEVVYILPREHNIPIPRSKTITFKQFADAIKGRGAIANRFALSLLEWAEHDAGTVPLGTPCPPSP